MKTLLKQLIVHRNGDRFDRSYRPEVSIDNGATWVHVEGLTMNPGRGYPNGARIIAERYKAEGWRYTTETFKDPWANGDGEYVRIEITLEKKVRTFTFVDGRKTTVREVNAPTLDDVVDYVEKAKLWAEKQPNRRVTLDGVGEIARSLEAS